MARAFGPVPPTASIVSTLEDMARFMVAHLQNGRYGTNRMLSDSAAERMHRQYVSLHPRVPGWTLGFQVNDLNGRRIIEHGLSPEPAVARLQNWLNPVINWLGDGCNLTNVDVEATADHLLADDCAQDHRATEAACGFGPAPAHPAGVVELLQHAGVLRLVGVERVVTGRRGQVVAVEPCDQL